jgi:hypothetical protein
VQLIEPIIGIVGLAAVMVINTFVLIDAAAAREQSILALRIVPESTLPLNLTAGRLITGPDPAPSTIKASQLCVLTSKSWNSMLNANRYQAAFVMLNFWLAAVK